MKLNDIYILLGEAYGVNGAVAREFRNVTMQRDRAIALLNQWMDAEEGAEPSEETHAFLVEVEPK